MGKTWAGAESSSMYAGTQEDHRIANPMASPPLHQFAEPICGAQEQYCRGSNSSIAHLHHLLSHTAGGPASGRLRSATANSLRSEESAISTRRIIRSRPSWYKDSENVARRRATVARHPQNRKSSSGAGIPIDR